MKRFLPFLALSALLACDAEELPTTPLGPDGSIAPQLQLGDEGPWIEVALGNFYNHLHGSEPERTRYGFGFIVHAWGDFSGVSAESVAIEVGGHSFTPPEVERLSEQDGFSSLHMGPVWLDAPPPLGIYTVTVRDDHGALHAASVELKGFTDQAPDFSFPWPDAITSETRPTFSWQPMTEVYEGIPVPLVGLLVSLHPSETPQVRYEAQLPLDATELTFESPYWDTPPPSLRPGWYNVTIQAAYSVGARIRFEHHRTVSFRMAEPVRVEQAQFRLHYGYFAHREGAFSYEFHHSTLHLVGDFQTVSPADVVFTVDGVPLPASDDFSVGPSDIGDVRVDLFGSFPGGIPPLGRYEVRVLDDHGVPTTPYLLGDLVELPAEVITITEPTEGAEVDGAGARFAWEPFALPYGGASFPSDNYGVELYGVPGEEVVRTNLPPERLAIELGDPAWQPPLPGPLPPGRYHVSARAGHFVGPGLRLVGHRGVDFSVGGGPQLANATLVIHAAPEGNDPDLPQDPDYQWFRVHLYANGDFGGVTAEDVDLTVAGQRIPLEGVQAQSGGDTDYHLEAWGDFGGGRAPLGRYEVVVRDASGETTHTFDLGILEDHPRGMSRMLYPLPGALISEPRPTFRWDAGPVEYLGTTHQPSARSFWVSRHPPPEANFFAGGIPGSVTELPFASPYWGDPAPDELIAGTWELNLGASYWVLPRVVFVIHHHLQFSRSPETLTVHPDPRPLSEVGRLPMDYVARDEEALAMALRLAEPGEVIGVDGMITLKDFSQPVGVRIEKDGVTMTGATALSGLRADPGKPVNQLIVVSAAGITLSHLRLDASEGVRASTILLQNPGTPSGAAGSVIADNDLACAPLYCVAVGGAAKTTIVRNRMVADGVVGAVLLQGTGPAGPDGTRLRNVNGAHIEDNVIVMLAPRASASALLGGIHVRDGRDVRIVGNTVTGPFPNSISGAALRGSLIEKNRTAGATAFALLLDGTQWGQVEDVLLKNNHFNDAGVAGGYVDGACSLTFVGNNLSGNPDNVGLVLDTGTGASVVAGNGNRVLDQGATDCDGDGVVDPNQVAGGKGKAKGVQFGRLISEAIRRIKESLAGGVP